MIGEHNVANAVAAAALATQVGATHEQIQSGLQSLSKVKRRVDVEKLNDTITLIDDSYNASVPAMKAGVDLLGQFTQHSVG